MQAVLYIILFLFSISFANAGWNLTFDEEFNSETKINTALWNVFYSFSPTVINDELEFYSPDGFTFTSTSARIVAERRANLGPSNYTSGVITTENKFSQRFGYFEMNASIPFGQGFWPAFWLLPESSSRPQEIDIMEIINPAPAPTTVYTTFHCDYNSSNPLNKQGTKVVSGLADGHFHTYGLQWYPSWLIWYVDRTQVWNLTNSCIPNNPEYILANLAIGGSWPGPPNSSTLFPSYMEIDYIRAYSYVSSGGTNLGGDVGNGNSYTAPAADKPASAFYLGLITASPETSASAGGTVVVNITLYSNVTITNYNVGIYFYPYTTGSSGNTVVAQETGVFNCAGGYVRCNTYVSVLIPSGTAVGYYRGAIGIFDSNWNNLFWLDAVVMIGVGSSYIVGGKGATAGSASPSPKVY